MSWLRRQPDPSWQVQVVRNPDDPVTDFSYTTGLGAQGLPELYLAAWPSAAATAPPAGR